MTIRGEEPNLARNYHSAFEFDRVLSELLVMRMSCNGCRVLRKGCSETCIIRPCLQWIKNEESQANATVFLAKFYGRAGLMNLISAGPEHLRPAIFRSLLYEACGRMVNPIFGSVGLLCSGSWQLCQAAVESILKGSPIHPILVDSSGIQMPTERSNTSPSARSTLMETITNELHKVKTKGRFKRRRGTAKDSSLNNSDAEDLAASQVFNLRWRRCYPGEVQAATMEGTPNKLVTSDSSCESLEHFDDLRNHREAEIEGNMSEGMDMETVKVKCCNDQNDHKPTMESVIEISHPQAADLENMQPIKQEYESIDSDDTEVKLELTLNSQGPVTHAAEKYHTNLHWNSCMEQSDEPTITHLGLGLTQA